MDMSFCPYIGFNYPNAKADPALAHRAVPPPPPPPPPSTQTPRPTAHSKNIRGCGKGQQLNPPNSEIMQRRDPTPVQKCLDPPMK